MRRSKVFSVAALLCVLGCGAAPHVEDTESSAAAPVPVCPPGTLPEDHPCLVHVSTVTALRALPPERTGVAVTGPVDPALFTELGTLDRLSTLKLTLPLANDQVLAELEKLLQLTHLVLEHGTVSAAGAASLAGSRRSSHSSCTPLARTVGAPPARRAPPAPSPRPGRCLRRTPRCREQALGPGLARP
jgi:hypothetical protein